MIAKPVRGRDVASNWHFGARNILFEYCVCTLTTRNDVLAMQFVYRWTEMRSNVGFIRGETLLRTVQGYIVDKKNTSASCEERCENLQVERRSRVAALLSQSIFSWRRLEAAAVSLNPVGRPRGPTLPRRALPPLLAKLEAVAEL